MKRVQLLGLAAALVVLAAPVAAGTGTVVTPMPAVSIDVHASETHVTFPDAASAGGVPRPDLGSTVALPPDCTAAHVRLVAGRADRVALDGGVMRLRGRPVVVVRVHGPADGPITVAVSHDGSWSAKTRSRLASAVLHGALPGLPADAGKAASGSLGGSYVIVTAPQFADAVAPLADWKMRKGWPVVTVTTDETGASTSGIKAWLQNAYDTWLHPPEYILLVGDVDAIPVWGFSGNITDLPYTLLDGDDWLPDAMLGRFSVSNGTEARTLVAKTVAYERTPETGDTDWFTRGVMVAGQTSSETPMYTVEFCGRQLEDLGFEPLVAATPFDSLGVNYMVSPPQPHEGVGLRINDGPNWLRYAIDPGCSIIAYRGWAQGPSGWEAPKYLTGDIPALDNGARMPVVMSFVCLNGDFAADTPCFGEVFTRLGTPEPEGFRGGVAFIGNGEHWSHTWFNDAMAISVFEEIVEPSVSTLGGLLNAGKLRFLDYYPGHVSEEGDEQSAEFYFHIYSLLGDPELNYHRTVPTPIAATHATAVDPGATLLDVAADGAVGARVAVVQDGHLLGAATVAQDGTARVVFGRPAAIGALAVTVTAPGRLPHEADITCAGSGDAVLGLDDLAVDAGDDGLPAPGETVALTPTLRNLGGQTSTAATITLSLSGPASVTVGTGALGALEPGAAAASAAPLEITIDASAPDGAVIRGRLDIAHDGEDRAAAFEIPVSAPGLSVTGWTAGGDGWIDPGATAELSLAVTNLGALPAAGGTLGLEILDLDGVDLLTPTATYAAVPAGGATTVGPVSVQVGDAVPDGATVTLVATATDAGGAIRTTSLPLPVGRGDVTQPVGPDGHGYYAYDSADYLYPGSRPVYRWREISAALGGPGALLPFTIDNHIRDITLDLPFTVRFYGEDFDRIRVGDNGWLSFEADNTDFDFYNWPLPSQYGCGALVAPFCDNLDPTADAGDDDDTGLGSDGVYWYHDTVAGEVIVEWSRMRHYKPDIQELQSFQVVLRDPSGADPTPSGDHEILFQYKQVDDNDWIRYYATVGIESPDEMAGLQLSHDGVRAPGCAPLGPGLAIRLTTRPPVRVPVTVATLERAPGPDGVRLSWSLDDPRPVTGWRIHAERDGRRVALTPEPLPADVRTCTVAAAADEALVIEALLPHGGRCDAGKSDTGAATVDLALRRPVPNPVRGASSIAFAVPRTGPARLRIYDVRGRCVRTLLDGSAKAGESVVVWQGRDDAGRPLADGVYVYRLEHAGRSLTRKLLLVR